MYGTDLRSIDAPTVTRWGSLHKQPYIAGPALDSARAPRLATRSIATALPLLSADLLAAILCFSVGWRVAARLWPAEPISWPSYCILLALGVCLTSAIFGLYPGVGLGRMAELRQASSSAITLAVVALIVLSWRAGTGPGVRFAILGTSFLLPPVLLVMRSVTRLVVCRFRWWGQTGLIVGDSLHAGAMYTFLCDHPQLGLRALGVVCDWPNDRDHAPPYVLGPLARAAAIECRVSAQWLIVTPGTSPDEAVLARIAGYSRAHRLVIRAPQLSPGLWRRASGCLDWPGNRLGPATIARFVKRAIDVSLTLVGGLLTMPLMLFIALCIKLTSPGPALYWQQRVGQHGRRFMVCKFRTMICNGKEVLDAYLAAHPQQRLEWDRDHKLRDDPRVTSIGRWLRCTSLDELPQLWNVLRGQMSLVGPRPILASEIADFGDDFQWFCSVLPGITGLWQVSGRNHTTYSEHIELDSYYARNWSLWLDWYILLLTVRVVLFRDGAY